MNQASHLCVFLDAHPNDWETVLTEQYGLRIKHDGDLAIFNYQIACDFHDPIVQEARGIILNTATRTVVCWPFRKFGNYSESYADTIDWSTARVLEKVDGSIVKLWYDQAADKWQFSTNGTIRAELANVDGHFGLTFGDVLRKAENYGDIPFDTLDRSYTYIFELVSPETQVVVHYGKTALYHLGTRNNQTGAECEMDIGIEKPASYALGSLSDCVQAAIKLNEGTTDTAIAKEGFVVVDGNYHRVKIKSPDYIMMHHLHQNAIPSRAECLEILLSSRGEISGVCKANPNLAHVFKFYDYQLAELCHQADRIAELSRKLYAEYGERKAVARILIRHRLSHIGFLALDRCEKKGRELLLGLPLVKMEKLVPQYVPDDLNKLFEEA